MAIVFDHAVIYAGKYYPANTPIVEAVKPAQKADEARGEEIPAEKAKPAQKATKGRKKGDA